MNTFQFTPAVLAARNNDEQAFALLYEKSYSLLKKEALKYVKSEFDADDILQNTYISIFKNIGTLKDPEKFLSWAVTICRNFCVNECVRSNRVSERTEFRPDTSEEDKEGLDTIAASEYDLSVNPEAAYDAYETKRLLDEMIDDLPAMQRTCIMLWQEEFSAKEIAAKTGLAEGTVKSNVNYAKKKIKEKVLLLEKQGTKLYGLAPIPFFLWIMRLYERGYRPESIADGAAGSFSAVSEALASGTSQAAVSASGSAAVNAGTTISSSAGKAVMAGTAKTAAKAAAAAGAKTAVGTAFSKAVIGIVVGAIAVGAGVGTIAAVNANHSSDRSASAESGNYSDMVVTIEAQRESAASQDDLQEEINKEAEKIVNETVTPAPAETAAPEESVTPREEQAAPTVIEAASYVFTMPKEWEGKVEAEVNGDEIYFTWHGFHFANFYTQADLVATGGSPDVIGKEILQLPDGNYLILGANNDSGLIKTGAYPVSELTQDECKELIQLESGGTVTYDECLKAEVYQGALSEDIRSRIDKFYMDTVIKGVALKGSSEQASAAGEAYKTDSYTFVMPENWQGKIRVEEEADSEFFTDTLAFYFNDHKIGSMAVMDYPPEGGEVIGGPAWAKQMPDGMWVHYTTLYLADDRNPVYGAMTEEERSEIAAIIPGSNIEETLLSLRTIIDGAVSFNSDASAAAFSDDPSYNGTLYETAAFTFNTPKIWDGNIDIVLDETQKILAFYSKKTATFPIAYIAWGTSQEIQQLNMMTNAIGFGLYDVIWTGTASNGDTVSLSLMRIPAETLVTRGINEASGTTNDLTEEDKQKWQDMLDYSSGMTITADECLETEKTVSTYTDPRKVPEFSELYKRQDAFFNAVILPRITLK